MTKYFTKPARVFATMVVVYFGSVLVYLCNKTFFGANGNATSLKNFGDALYFSLITFTTIGYGDIYPTGGIKFFAGIEGFLGVLLISTYLVTLARKYLR